MVLEETAADGEVQLFQGSMEQKQLEKFAKGKAKKEEDKQRVATTEEARKGTSPPVSSINTTTTTTSSSSLSSQHQNMGAAAIPVTLTSAAPPGQPAHEALMQEFISRIKQLFNPGIKREGLISQIMNLEYDQLKIVKVSHLIYHSSTLLSIHTVPGLTLVIWSALELKLNI